MSSAIVIHHKDVDGKLLATYYFAGCRSGFKLEDAQHLRELVSSRPHVYETGLGSLPTFKRLVKICARLQEGMQGTLTVERQPVEPGQLTATGGRIWGQGTVRPINVRGG